ncbi:MAG: SbcC/MukB-like Walker B domain-containing protein, partial [Planctomycetota bacterium]
RKAHDEAKQRLEQAERELAKTQVSQGTTEERIEETDKALARLVKELTENERQLDELRKEIGRVTAAPDPEAERDGLLERIENLEFQQKIANDAAARTKNQLTATEQAFELKTKAAAEDEHKATERQKTRDERVDQAGFEDAHAVETAVRDPDVQKELRDRVQTHERELHTVEERVTVLKEELGTDRVSKDQLEAATKRASALTDEVEKLVGQGQKLQQQVESMRKRIERSKELREELETEEQAYRLYSHLATDLRSDKFQAYVLEETFTELVRGASTRLLALTGDRYSLEFAEDQIVVVDHDNAGETRISDTLSGGETFLTSLSLALELSDQVQRAAGAVNLDSLFIDEGFGTLDPDTLDVVSETIQSLQVGGRMVGIITHIPELRDEFSQQILVTKHQGYSTVEVRPREA